MAEPRGPTCMVPWSFMVQLPPFDTGELHVVNRLSEAYPGTWGPCAATTGLSALAECPNGCAKPGGIGMEVNVPGWHERAAPPTSRELTEATRRYYEHAVELVGVERCMFESNFPVEKVSCRYGVLWNSFKRLAADYSAGERARLFHDTTARAHRLGPPVTD